MYVQKQRGIEVAVLDQQLVPRFQGERKHRSPTGNIHFKPLF